MTDFAGPAAPIPTHVTALSAWGHEASFATGGINYSSYASGAWPSANLAVYIPLQIPWTYPVKRMFWLNGSAGNAAGNVAIALYSIGGARFYASGAVAQSGNSASQYHTPSRDIVLPPGRYWLGFICDGTGANRLNIFNWTAAADARLRGMVQQAVGSTTFPATMTAATMAQTVSPYIGITRTTTGY